MSDAATPLLSPLHDRHVALGAKFGDFGGWSMPLEYAGGGVVAEHTAVRERVGVFDVSHLGKASVTGPGAAAFLDSVLTNALDRIAPGQGAVHAAAATRPAASSTTSSPTCAADDDVFLIPNAVEHRRGRADPARARRPTASRSTDQHHDHAVLAVQGPRSAALLDALGLPTDLDYMAFAPAEHDGVADHRLPHRLHRRARLRARRAVGRSAGAVWDALLAAGAAYGVLPCGLGARDTLRTEMGYPLHGQDLSLEITPVQARAGWAVGWKQAGVPRARRARRREGGGPGAALGRAACRSSAGSRGRT